ncbi:MAG: hypothetical protein Q8M15_06455 [Bacteroidota bacterium]|nr:hypothetical protein [Bacteroidota bacterium]
MKSIIINRYFLKKLGFTIAVSSILFNISTAQITEKRTTTIQLSFYKKANISKTIVGTVKAKNEEGKFLPAINAKVNFYLVNNNAQTFLKAAYTNKAGKANIILPENLPLDTGHCFTIAAKIENDKVFEDAVEELRYKEANLELKLAPYDTSRIAKAVLKTIGKNGEVIPVQDVEIKFYVKRLFGFMPAAEDYTLATDENGEASFTYPKDIMGDTAGILTVVARIDDNELFGNMEYQAVTAWGTVLLKEKEPFPRALWEPYAPLPLIITIAVLFGGVWFTYLIIFYSLYKIKKEKSDEQIEFEAIIKQ